MSSYKGYKIRIQKGDQSSEFEREEVSFNPEGGYYASEEAGTI